MNKHIAFIALLSLQTTIQALTFYPPFSDSPCQTTYGPGSYGKSVSDVRYRDGWSWKRSTDKCTKQCHKK